MATVLDRVASPAPLHRRAVPTYLAVCCLIGAGIAVATAGTLHALFGSELVRALATDLGLRIDYDTFWRSAVALWRGADIYQTGAAYANLNPPFFTVLFAPLGLIEIEAGFRLWQLLIVGLMLACLCAAAAELRTPTSWTVIAGAAVLVSSPMVATVAHGQMYVLLTCALTVCWLADRRGRPIAAGVALGLAIAIKPSLLPVLLLPLMRRQWTVLGSAVTAAAAASVVGVAAAGWSSLSSWFGLMANGTANPITNNASLPSAIVRMFSPNEVAAPLVELPGATLLGLALAIAVLAITAARIRHRPAPGVPDTALWATVAAALLASPIAWFHYLVLLAPAALVVAAAGRRPQALLLLALPLIGVEWFTMWPAEQPGSALPLSLWAGVLLLCWLALLPGGSAPEPARPQPQPWALTESR